MNVREMFHVKHRPAQESASAWLRHCSAMAMTLLILTGCTPPGDIAAQTATTPPESPVTPPVPPPVPAAGKTTFADNSSAGEVVREFSYEWPKQVTAIPALAADLAKERDQALKEQKAEWDEARREFADQDCTGCMSRSFEKTWEVVADLPRFLSLSAGWAVYSGGAHGNYGLDARIWDREANRAFDPRELFTSPEALQSALGEAWCKALAAERRKRLGGDFSDDGIFGCAPIAELTVLAGSSGGAAFDRIGLYAAPYVVGSYAEGAYEATLPVTPAVLAAVKPEYRAAFALAK
jgi:hypothetical protein